MRQWEAHDKRIWSVDFCPLDATTFATGSDDGTVKVRRGTTGGNKGFEWRRGALLCCGAVAS